MSYLFYKWLHITFVVFTLLTLVYAHYQSAQGAKRSYWKLLHGIGVFFVFVSGFGILAKLGIFKDLPGWVWGKLVLGLVLGGALLITRFPSWVRVWIGLGPFLVGLATYLALYKPF